MDLRYLLSVLWRWGWLVVLSTGLAAGLSYRVNSRAPVLYQATTTVLVGSTVQAENPNSNDFYIAQSLAKDYTALATGQTVLQATVSSLELKESWEALAQQVNASSMQNAETLDINVVDRDPKQAKLIADEIARQLVSVSPTPKQGDPQRQFTNQQMTQLATQIKNAQAQIQDLQKQHDSATSAVTLQDLNNQISVLQQKVKDWQNTYAQLSNFYQGSKINYLTIVRPATVPIQPIGTNLKYNVALAGGVGFLLAIAGIVVIEFVDDTVKGEADAVRTFHLPILGGIRWVRGAKLPADLLFATKMPNSPVAEACRFLSANVSRPGGAAGEGSVLVLVTSPGPRDGKSVVAANLAAAVAESGTRVILLDANLHRPSTHRFFDLPNREGLSTLLVDDSRDVESVLQSTAIPSLRVLTTGPLLPIPSGALTSRAMIERLAQIRGMTEVVVMDAAALLGAADASVLGTLSDEVILVVRPEQTRRGTTRQAIELLGRVGVQVRGIVLNGRTIGRTSYQRYYAVAAPKAVPAVDQHCPELGLRSDRSSIVLAPSADHRCYASGSAVKVTEDHQKRYCLCSAYGTCPRLTQARTSARMDATGARPEIPAPLHTSHAGDNA